MEISFQKLHGLGNDFIVVDASQVQPDPVWAKRVCDRHFGVGADGVLYVDTRPEIPRLVILNQDGSRPQMCGNGVRCVARYLVESLGFARKLTIMSDAGPRCCIVGDDWRVAVDMGPGRVDSTVSFHDFHWLQIDMGNPHAVTFLDAMPPLDHIDVVGADANRRREMFTEGVNLEFCVIDGSEIHAVVYERGVGRTMACGTGACAAAVASWEEGLLPRRRTVVKLPGGRLEIEEKDGIVWMTGDACLVYQGVLAPMK